MRKRVKKRSRRSTKESKRKLAEAVVDRYYSVKRLARIPGGKAARVRPSKFPRGLLVEGTIVELEHTSDPRVALEIALDHLAESADYYSQLAKIHKENPSSSCCSSCARNLPCESECLPRKLARGEV